jgi:molybdenum cofactor synthesis domain-containing protein
MATAEIIVVGNEVLLGLVQDTNSGYLCRVVRGRRGTVRHIAVVADEIDSIAEEIGFSLNRHSDLIFTCGGLGPTEDDMTLAAVAKACDHSLVLDPAAHDFVIRRYEELAAHGHVAGAALTGSRVKMARLPDGAMMVENPVGTAPGTVLRFRGSVIVSLPGVPAELKGIVEGTLDELLSEVLGAGTYLERELLIDCSDESLLAPLLREVAAAHPDVYIKSRARSFGPDVKLRVTLAASGASSEEVESRIGLAAGDLTTVLRSHGIQEVLA